MYSISKICEKRKSKLMIGSHARSSIICYIQSSGMPVNKGKKKQVGK